jgi:hypothetical protein
MTGNGMARRERPRIRRRNRPGGPLLFFLLSSLLLAACSESDPIDPGSSDPLWDLAECEFNLLYLADGGVGLDGIPALSEPEFLDPGPSQGELSYLEDEARVVGIVVEGQALALPLGALWHHEIINVDRGNTKLAVTHSTLTGSSRVYLRSGASNADFGVSGILYLNNTVLYDRNDPPSLWLQMTGESSCGPRSASGLSPYPFLETTWEAWYVFHPGTLVLGPSEQGSPSWGLYPYGDYENSPEFFFSDAMPELDDRRPPKERVLGIPKEAAAGIAFPFGDFREGGPVQVGHDEVDGRRLVVFWRDVAQGAAAYWADVAGEQLTFDVQENTIVDLETGTEWSFLGEGTGGGHDGAQLEAVPDATVAYWGAWAAFFPDTEIWDGG